jgi:hypothetical protein
MDKEIPNSRKSELLDMVKQRIEEDEATAMADYLEQISRSDDREGLLIRLVVAKFDISARYHLFLVANYADVTTWYEAFLKAFRHGMLRQANTTMSGWPASQSQPVCEKLGTLLAGRLLHWKGEALRRARTWGTKNESGQQTSVQNVRSARGEAEKIQLAALAARGEAIQRETDDESIAAQLDKFLDEANWTVEELAEALDLSPRSIFRHLSGQARPLKRNIKRYEQAFSNRLKRQVVIRKKS